jgi:hypothetical protein
MQKFARRALSSAHRSETVAQSRMRASVLACSRTIPAFRQRLKQYVPEVRACRRAASHITNRISRHVCIASAGHPHTRCTLQHPRSSSFAGSTQGRCWRFRPPAALRESANSCAILRASSQWICAPSRTTMAGRFGSCESSVDAGERSCIAEFTFQTFL